LTSKILVLDRSEELAEQVRAVMAEVDYAPEVVPCTKVGSLAHVQEHEGPFALVLAGPSLGTRAGLKRLAALHREMAHSAFLIAFDHRPDASLRDIVQVGAIDLVEVPADDATLRHAIRRALEYAEARRRTQVVLTQPAPGPGQEAPTVARIFTVCSATGGCGKTFYATNMAMFLAKNSDKRVALVDFDLQFGEVTTALRLSPTYTIVDAITPAGDEEDENGEGTELMAHIEDYLVHYDNSFWTLPAPREPSQADYITPMDATRVLEALRTRFDYIVVDTPTALAETVLAAFDLSEHLFVMATLDLPSVRNLGLFLQTLQKLQIASDNVSLILNKVEKDVGIDVGDIVKLFPHGFRSTLPYAKEVSRSINLGKPVIAGYPESEVSKRIVEGLMPFLPGDVPVGAMPAQGQPAAAGGFARLFKRKP